MAVVIFTVVLVVLGKTTTLLEPFKSSLMDTARPLYDLADMPNRILQWGSDRVMDKDDLLVKNAQLEAEGLVLRAKVQKLAALSIENTRLRELLNAGAPIKERLLLAQVISVSPNPLQHYVMVDKGEVDGVYVGQAVVDAYGLYGQVMNVAQRSSRILLVSDARHAIPVKINRNGVRLIAEGGGDYRILTVPNVALTSDVVKGDILSTSGLGGVFPADYPVGRVMDVKHDEGLPFVLIKVDVAAHLDRSRQVLLLFNRDEAPHEG